MKFCTIITTRSKSCSVKTLHTILKMNIHCIQGSHQNEILYVNDDPFEKANMIKNCISKCDRIFFIDFGINVDDESIKQLFQPHDNTSVLVFPGVVDGIDWDLFKRKYEKDPPNLCHKWDSILIQRLHKKYKRIFTKLKRQMLVHGL